MLVLLYRLRKKMGKCFSSASWSKIFSQPGEFLICVFFGLNKKGFDSHLGIFSKPCLWSFDRIFLQAKQFNCEPHVLGCSTPDTIPLVEQQK